MMSGRTTTTISAPAHGPLDYNSLRPSFGQLAPLFGLTLLALIPIALGGLLVYWSWPSDDQVGGLQVLGLGLGALLLLAGVRFFWPLSSTVPDAIKQYYAMAYSWHDAELSKYVDSSGLVTAQQVSEWTYSEADMRHILMLAMWLIVVRPKSLSIEALTKGPLLLPVDHRAFKLCDFTQDGAASFLDLLARAGVVQGRAPRKAGTIAIVDPRDAALRLLKEAARNPAALAAEKVR